ncbi:MAG: peptidase S16 [Sphingobacteriales bacterium]|nr:MAG: peptidase S16 [Sphingobacteriales bacterium]
MTNFIPIFPLSIVVYPGEQLNLHIFEPRYKQLIKECIAEQKPFGIPCVINDRVEEYGTLMQVTEMVQEYDNGEMDIRTKGTDIFRTLQIVDTIPDKLYQGAIVSYPNNVVERDNTEISKKIVSEVKRLYNLLDVAEKFPIKTETIVSYEIAHFVGLTQQQEYELLNIFTEIQRLEYLRRHLNSITSVVDALEKMKKRIKMNGHFRNLSLGEGE